MTTTAELLRTPLHDWHVSHGGRIVDFASWSMPVQYTSIADEHKATRNAVGVFDISHMGRLQFAGATLPAAIDTVVTRRVVDMKPGQVRYSLVCNDSGGILDDVLVYAAVPQADEFTIVVNASNREKIIDWLKDQLKGIAFKDTTAGTAMIAVQGPKAADVLLPFFQVPEGGLSVDLRAMRYYHCRTGWLDDGTQVFVSRTGYTGEDGFEIICPKAPAAAIWERIVAAAEKVGGMAAGLGARDTLRLEAAMPLYGHELSEAINPIQAGLDFAVNLGGRQFIGHDALEDFAADKSQAVRVGLQVDGKRVPRQGCSVLHGDEIVGEVTSGTFSPTFDRPIAMAYVRPTAQAVGTHLAVDIRGTQHAATVVPLPFYDRAKKN
jgi:glycine cleavage system T protein (aminomethyltransferase)